MQLNPNVLTLETLDDDLYLLPVDSNHSSIKTGSSVPDAPLTQDDPSSTFLMN